MINLIDIILKDFVFGGFIVYYVEFTYIPELVYIVCLFFLFCFFLQKSVQLFTIVKSFMNLMLFIFLFQLYIYLCFYNNGMNECFFISYRYIITPEILLFKAFVSLLAFLLFFIRYYQFYPSTFVRVFSKEEPVLIDGFYTQNVKSDFKSVLFFFVMNLAIFSIYVVISSYDFLIVYLCLELFSISSAILISCTHVRNKVLALNNQNLLWSLHYFTASTIGSCVFLLGVAYLYGSTSTLNFGSLSYHPQVELCVESFNYATYSEYHPLPVYFSLILIFLGLLVKGGFAPFHFWVLEIYSQVPYFVLTFFLIFPKFMILIIFSKLMIIFSKYSDFITYYYVIIGTCNILIGALLAIYQTDVKRFLVASSITNIGYLFFALLFFNKHFTMYLFLLYLAVYLISMLGILFILSTTTSGGLRGSVFEIKSISDLSFLPFYLKMYFIFFLFSLMGIPFLAGFWTKSLLLYHLNVYYYYSTLFVILLLSSLSLLYYLNFVKYLSFDDKNLLKYKNNLRFQSLKDLNKFLVTYFNFTYLQEFVKEKFLWYKNLTKKNKSKLFRGLLFLNSIHFFIFNFWVYLLIF